MNWVEKHWQEEQFLAANGNLLWRDLCNALKDAAHSYRDRYQGMVTVEDEKRENQFRVAVGEFSKQAMIDLGRVDIHLSHKLIAAMLRKDMKLRAVLS
jgi:hypothetical protein